MFVDQAGIYLIFFFVLTQQILQRIDIHAHADDADDLSRRIFDLAVYEQGDLVICAHDLVVIDIEAVFFGAVYKIVIPVVLRVTLRQSAVKKVLAGETTLREINRVTFSEER